MAPAVRVAMGIQLMEQFQQEGTTESLMKSVEIAEQLSRQATEAGQHVQAFSLLGKLTAEGLIVGYENSQTQNRRKIKKKNKNLYNGAKEGYKRGTKKASQKATKKVFGKNTPKTKKAKAFGMDKSQIRDGKKAALDKIKNATKGGGNTLTSGGINKELIEGLGEYGFYVFAEGVRTFKEWSRQMKQATGITDPEVLKGVWQSFKTETGKTLDELAKMASIEDVIAAHFDESTDNSKLAERLKTTLNIDDELAQGLADELTAEFNRIVTNERKNEINKRVKKTVSKKKRNAVDAVAEGEALTDQEIEETIEEAFGVKKMTPEQIAELKRITDERDARPEGFLRDEMTREALSYLESLDGVSKGDILWSLWYASILSGHETQILNVASNAMNISLETLVTAIEQGVLKKDPKMIADSISGFMKGMKQGSTEFQQVMTKGYSPEKAKIALEVKDALENTDFLGGKWNPATYAKYVGRFMTAVDSAAYMAARGMRKQEIAREIAKEEGLKGKKLAERVSEIMNDSKEAQEDAVETATKDIEAIAQRTPMSEREKRRLTKMRTQEILEETLPDDIAEKIHNFGSFVTFNYDPEGVLGSVAGQLSQLGRKLPPFRLVVPFTRIVANVLNQQVDYTPVGALRAYGISPSSWFKMDRDSSAKDVRDRHRKLIKSVIGTTLMTGLYMMIKSYEDDEDPFLDISGKGPADLTKKNQLYSQGWRPYSIKVGDKWISYQYTPLGVALSYVGNWIENERYEGLSKADFTTRTVFAMQSSASGVFDMSFLTGLSGLMSAMTSDADPEKQADKFLKTTGKITTSFIPNLFKQLDKIYDPTIYESKEITASILKEIPVVRHEIGLKPKLNAFGQPVQKIGNRFYGQATDDPVWQFMAKHKVFAPGLSPSTKTEDGETMTADQFYEYARISGQLAYEMIKDEMGELDDYFREVDSEERKKEIKRIFSEARQEAKYSIE
jgi:hypothetical protein